METITVNDEAVEIGKITCLIADKAAFGQSHARMSKKAIHQWLPTIYEVHSRGFENIIFIEDKGPIVKFFFASQQAQEDMVFSVKQLLTQAAALYTARERSRSMADHPSMGAHEIVEVPAYRARKLWHNVPPQLRKGH